MARQWTIPEAGKEWMTDELRAALMAIRGQHAAKKRTTIIKLAFARANQQPLSEIFGQRDTCNQRIWYQKWQFDPKIQQALELCYERAMLFADEETLVLEACYRQSRRRSVAKYAAQAPAALAVVMSDQEQRGSDRISAADTLMRWAEPDVAGKVGRAQPSANIEQSVNVIDGDTAESIFDILAAVGALEAGADDAQDDEIHDTPAAT